MSSDVNSPSSGSLASRLTAQIDSLQEHIRELQSERSDLEIMVETITEHSTDLENRIYEQNQQMQAYLREVECVTAAAAAVEDDTFQTVALDPVAKRSDELGQLARVFQRMFEQVKHRERELQRQLRHLEQIIEIDENQKKQRVNEILLDPSFQKLKQKLGWLKQKRDIRSV